MTNHNAADRILKNQDLHAIAGLGSVEVFVGVCALNQARSAAKVVETATEGLAKAFADRKNAVVVVEAGFRDETLDAVKSWMAGRNPTPGVSCVRITGPPTRGRAVLGALAIAQRLGTPVCVLLDAGLVSLTPETFGRFVQPALTGQAAWVSPVYTHAAAEGTLTTNLLAPMCRAVYGRRLQQLLGGCAALSHEVVARALEAEPWEGDLADHGVELRLVLEALTLESRIVEVHLGRKVLDPGLAPPELATTLARTVGPFFRLMERHLVWWSEVRGSTAVERIGELPSILADAGEVHVDRMVRAFRLGLKDLLPIWEQALQEDTLSSLYPLGLLSPDEFAFPADQWARVACDFAVAYHEQRLPRDHLLRALTPLYLGRVAAFLREAQAGPSRGVPTILDAVGRAFEAEKPGLVARWRERHE
jgi:hypothetical protein